MGENPLQLKVQIEVQGQLFSRALANDVIIRDENLHGEFIRQPELFAWWATTTELARDRVGRLKTELARKAAEIDAVIRNNARAENDRLIEAAKSAEKKVAPNLVRLTETMVQNSVITHPVYKEIEDELNDARKQLGLLIVGKEAMVQKKDMLISVGANYRAEGMSNPSILKDAVKERIRRKSQGFDEDSVEFDVEGNLDTNEFSTERQFDITPPPLTTKIPKSVEIELKTAAAKHKLKKTVGPRKQKS